MVNSVLGVLIGPLGRSVGNPKSINVHLDIDTSPSMHSQ